MKNIVLYRKDERGMFPLLSCSPDDKMAAFRVAQKATDSLRDADSRGVPAPELLIVLEERTANEGGVQTSAKFTELEPATLKPVDAKRKPAATLAELVEENK